MAFQGAAAADQPFKFKAGDHIVITRVTIFVQGGWIVRFHPGRNNHRSHFNLNDLIRHGKVDTALFTGLDTFAAGNRILTHAFFRIDNIGRGNCLGKRQVNCPPAAQANLVFIRDHHRADLNTIPTGCALGLIHITCLFSDPDFKITYIS